DLDCDDLNVVIGRLSDHDMANKRYKHWTLVRDVQVHFAENHPSGAWVDCDDLNDGKNRKGKPIKDGLHYSGEGYKVLGERFAEKAIELIRG
ncbi:MAG: acetyl xylan esterase, partial [Planctomycetota bacterium]